MTHPTPLIPFWSCCRRVGGSESLVHGSAVSKYPLSLIAFAQLD